MNYVRFFIALMGFGALTLYWYTNTINDEIAAEHKQDSSKPDYILYDVTQVSFNADGHLSGTIKAEQLKHFDQSHLSTFVMPKYTLYSQQRNSVWLLTAETGQLDHKSDILELNRNVHIQSLTHTSPVQSLTTENVDVHLNTDMLYSNDEVTIQGELFTIHGIGMIGDLTKELLEIKENIEGFYETP
jgi:lipopolysaccharide export system protein LptC